MSDAGYNIWGVVAEVIGVVTPIPVFYAWLQTRLPSARLPPLLQLVEETQKLFQTALQETLFVDEEHLYWFHLNMAAANINVDEFRARVYGVSAWEDVMSWWHGLSNQMLIYQAELELLRARFAKHNSEARRRLALTRIATNLTILSHYKDIGHYATFCSPPTSAAPTEEPDPDPAEPVQEEKHTESASPPSEQPAELGETRGDIEHATTSTSSENSKRDSPEPSHQTTDTITAKNNAPPPVTCMF
ncbi:hypothetical protein BD413DRAFT_522992 [Trametes elegans]|nr:hypothetical protein BD413DRAFT_522992 [Trametes elegans]